MALADETPRMATSKTDQNPESNAADLTLALDDNRTASMVFGHYDQNLARIERRLNVVLTANGNHVVIKGAAEPAGHARRVLQILCERARGGRFATLGDVDGAIQECALQGNLFPKEAPTPRSTFEQVSTRKKGAVRARTAAQDLYIREMKRFELVFAAGPAGTGKTWLAVGHAVSLLEQGVVERLILSRPAVEAGERLGFLPGDMREKVDPYLRPIYDALQDFMDPRMVERGMQTGMIEVAPLALCAGAPYRMPVFCWMRRKTLRPCK